MSSTKDFEALQQANNTKDQVLNATMICLIRLGVSRTNISTIAAEAGVSRPTVYAYFENLEELIQAAMQRGTGLLVKAIQTHAGAYENEIDRIVAAFVHILQLADQVPVLKTPMEFTLPEQSRDRIPDEALPPAREGLAILLDSVPQNENLANEQAETAVRFFLSLAAFKRPSGAEHDVEGYIRRVVVPALGLNG